MTVYIDKQSGNWKLKTKRNGKDTRVTLRKALPGESNANKPPDVLVLASKHTGVFESKESGSTTRAANPESIMEFMDWFGVDYPKMKAAGSAVRMERIIRWFREFIGKDCSVSAITTDTVRAWANSRDGKVKGQTIKSDLIYLSALFKQALERGIIDKNPVSPVLRDYNKRFPPTENIKYLTDGERKDFLERVDSAVKEGKLTIDFADVFKVMLATGMRANAAVNMQWEWLTADGGIQVPPSSTAIPTKTKTGYTAEVAPIGKAVLARRKTLHATGRIFPNITYATAYYQLKSKFGIHPHQLRHTFATALVDAEKPILTICECLGQKDLNTTQVYARVRNEAKKAAVASLLF